MSRFLSLLATLGLTAGAEAFAAMSEVTITSFPGNCKAAVSLTFDDAFTEHYTLVAPQLDKYGLKGTFAIIGSEMDDVNDDYAPRLTWQQCREMARNGHEISNHTWSHRRLSTLPPDTIRHEIAKTDSAMNAELGFMSRTIVYPYNDFNDSVRAICEHNKVGGRIRQFGLGQHNNHCTRQAIDKFLNEIVTQGEWGVTMTHGIHTGWDQWNEPGILWDLFRTLSQKSDTIYTDTFANISAYIAERDATTLTTDLSDRQLLIAIDCPLNPQIYNVPLTLKITGLKGCPVTATQAGKTLRIKGNDDSAIIISDVDPHGGAITITPTAQD